MGDEEKAPAALTFTERLGLHKRRGKYLVEKAELLLQTGTSNKSAVAAFLKFDDCAQFYYRASVSFRACSKFRESGDTLVKCAKMHQKLKLFLEAATLFTEAAEVFLKVDKGECVRSMRSAISIYCDAGKFEIAARMERKVAYMHFTAKHYEESAFHFKKAANFLSGEQLLDQSDHCLEMSVKCYLELMELEKVREGLEMVAFGCTQSNLRRFNGRAHLFTAVLTLFHTPLLYRFRERTEVILRPGVKQTDIVTIEQIIDEDSASKYNEILLKCREYEDIDFHWRVAKQHLFISNLIRYRLEFDLDTLIDHIYFFNNVIALDMYQLRFIKTMVDEVQTEIDRRIEVKRLIKMRRDQGDARRVKRAELKEQMEELGLDAAIAAEAMEKMFVDDEQELEDSKTHLSLNWENHFNANKKGKNMRAMAAAEHSDHMDDMAPDEPEEGEEGEEGEKGEEGGGGGEKKEEAFQDSDSDKGVSSEEDEGPIKKEEKKDRKKRAPDPKKQIL